MQLGEALKVCRKGSRLLQKQIAGIIGVSTEYYNKIENGKVVPSWRVINRIVGLLGISVEFSDSAKSKLSQAEGCAESGRNRTGVTRPRTKKLTIVAKILQALFVASTVS